MRLGVIWSPNNSAANYRAIEPMRAMERRGHEVVWPPEGGAPIAKRLTGCDAVHIHRRHDDETRRIVGDLARAGIGITYDNDDDFAAAPKEHPLYRRVGGLHGQRLLAETFELARLARVFTTPTEPLAEKYAQAGAGDVRIIPNHLLRGVSRRRCAHEGLVVGWIAGMEHVAEVARIPIVAALEAVLERHPAVRVECIGVDLRMGERYRHDPVVAFGRLPERIGAFDIGIAPLADIAFNRARSDIKVKEYAATGVPWLASPVGPYRSLGPEQGGLLVDDDEWEIALERLIESPRLRRRLGRKGARWAKGETIEAASRQWERAFSDAARARA